MKQSQFATWFDSLMSHPTAVCDRNFGHLSFMASLGGGRSDHRGLALFRALQRFKVQMANRGFQRLLGLHAVVMLATACSSIDLETGFVRDRRVGEH